MELQVGVKILLKNDANKYLILLRSNKNSLKVYWDIPGGRINTGCSLEENLKREVQEEAGLNVIGEPKLISAQDILKNNNHVVRLTYEGIAEGGNVKLSDEHSDYKWLTIDEIKRLEPLDEYLLEILNKNHKF